MKIENIDLLKQWLVNVLNPIFDGDPEKLALYIVALAKKVEDDQPSRERCINDLEVFLETNTHKFVDSLFETLISKKYLASPSGSSSSTAPTVATGSNEQVSTPTVDTTSSAQNNNTNNNNIIRLNTNTGHNNSDNNRRHNDSNRYDPRDLRSRRFNNNNYEDNNRRSENNSHQNRGNNNFNKSRLTRDYEEVPGRSDRPSGRERHKNRSRNRTHRGADSTSSSSSSSPETSSSRRYRRSRSYSRSRSNSPRASGGSSTDPNVNKKKRCRDFDEKGFCTMAEYCPYDHGEVVIAPALNTNKASSSLNPNEHQSSQISSNQNFSVPPPNMPSHQGQFTSNSGGDMYYQRHNHSGGRGGMQNHNMGRNNMHNNNNRPGMLHNPGMQGIQPRFPINDSNIQDFNHQQDFQQRQMMGGNRPRNLVNIVTSVNDNQGDNNYQGNQQRGMKRSYNNLNAPVNDPNFQYTNQQQMNMPQMQEYNPSSQQQSALLPNPPGMAPNNLHQPIPQQQQQFNHNKPSNFNQNQSNNQSNQSPNTNTSLVLRKVPVDMNRPEIIRQHFLKFGQIMDVQCKYDNLSDATLIRFANNQQAFAAFKSPESILNNRFIRIHWLNYHQKVQNQQQNQHQNQGQMKNQMNELPISDEPSLKRHVKDRISTDQNLASVNQHDSLRNKENKHLKTHHQPRNIGSSIADSIKREMTNPEGNTESDSANEASKVNEGPEKSENQSGNGQVLSNNFNSMSLKQAQQVDKSKYHESMAAAKAINDENQKKVLLLKMQVKQKARELIEQQIKDQKLLLKKFEQAKTVDEKSQILSLVKKLSESIEKEKDILNNKSYSLDEQQHPVSSENPSNFNSSPFSFQKINANVTAAAAAPKSIPAPPHSLKLNNLRYNHTNFLKNQALNMQMNAAQAKATPSLKDSPTAHTKQMFSFGKDSIDNRPKKLIITGVENIQEKEAILNFVNAVGCQVESATEAEKNETSNLFSFIVSFCTRKDAEMALAKCSSSLTSKTISITWYLPPAKTTSEASASPKETAESDSPMKPEVKSETHSEQENSQPVIDLNKENSSTESASEDAKEVTSETHLEQAVENDLVAEFFDSSATGEEILS